MAVISLKSFTGGIPRVPADRLPPNAAQNAQRCDFAYGDLRGIKIAIPSVVLGLVPASFYTKDGASFYAWPMVTEAAISPVISDTYKRLYYTTGNGADARVVSMGSGTYGEPPAGGAPTGYKLGVPGPSSPVFLGESELYARTLNYDATPGAPIQTTSTCLHTNEPGVSAHADVWTPAIYGLTIKVNFFYEVNGTKYQETDCSFFYDEFDATTFTLAAPFTVLATSEKYAETMGNKVRILGRDFHVKFPKLQASVTNAVITAATPATGGNQYVIQNDYGVPDQSTPLNNAVTAATSTTTTTNIPTTATPVLQVTGYLNGVEAFSVYSEGSAFTNQPGIMGAKLFTNKAAGDTVMYCGLKYGFREARAYVYTHVNVFGEESPPSLPVIVDLGWGQTSELYGKFTQFPQKGTGTTDYAPIQKTRLYGTNTTSQGNTRYYFVSESAITSTTPATVPMPSQVILFSGPQWVRPEKFGESLITYDYGLPPAGATGLCAAPNGMMACHRHTSDGAGMNELWLCEPYQPSAWPVKYVRTFPHDIVGIRAQGTGFVVTTKGIPYYVYGAHPDSMSDAKLNMTLACVNKRAMADVGKYIVYASNEGLVYKQIDHLLKMGFLLQ